MLLSVGWAMGCALRYIFSIAWLVCFGTTTRAADIWISDDANYSIVLEGTIKPGDYNKLQELLNANCPKNSWNTLCPRGIFLASPGGSVGEAIQIGRLVRTLGLQAEIPEGDTDVFGSRDAALSRLKLRNARENYLCARACFFVAIAGIDRLPYTERHRPLLGIHRPFLSDEELKTLNVNQAMSYTVEIRSTIEAYLKEMGVPLRYAELMFSIPRDQIRWITPAEYKADFSYLIPEIIDWLNAQCGSDMEFIKQLDTKPKYGTKYSPEELKERDVLFGEMNKLSACRGSMLTKMREEAWKAYRGL